MSERRKGLFRQSVYRDAREESNFDEITNPLRGTYYRAREPKRATGRTEKSPVREVGERERERKRNKNKTPLRVEANLFFGARPCEISQPFLNANVDAGLYTRYTTPSRDDFIASRIDTATLSTIFQLSSLSFFSPFFFFFFFLQISLCRLFFVTYTRACLLLHRVVIDGSRDDCEGEREREREW